MPADWYLEIMSPMGHWSPQLWTDRPSVQTIHGTDYLRSPGGHSPRVRAVQEVPDHLAGAGLKALQAALSPDAAAQTDHAPTGPHPDDLAIDRCAAAMKAKLAKKRAEGRGGWDGPTCSAAILSQLLREHVAKGDPVDVANLAMMLHQRGERIEPSHTEQDREAPVAATLERVRKEIASRRALLNSQFEALDIARDDAVYAICEEIIAQEIAAAEEEARHG